jgi:hypothetical protein
MRTSWNRWVCLCIREIEVIIYDFRHYITTDDGRCKDTVNIVCNTATVVDVSDDKTDNLEWDFFKVIQEDFQLSHRHTQVLISKGIWNIPSDGSKLPSVLANSMEERQSEV